MGMLDWMTKKTIDGPTSTLKESEFRDQIVELARMYSWRCYWTWNSIHSPKGFPDLVLVKNCRCVVAELKVGNRKLTWAQQDWLHALDAVEGVEVKIWRPSDWEDIKRTITGDHS